jgi:Tfp pilus assembly protein PilV
MVAVTILAVGILSMGQLFAISSQNATFSRQETMAVSLVREIQEKIMSESVDQVKPIFHGVDTTNPGTVTAPCEEWAAHVAEQLGPTGRGTITVLDAVQDAELLDGMFSVQVEVSWHNRGDTLSVPLKFAITNIGS